MMLMRGGILFLFLHSVFFFSQNRCGLEHAMEEMRKNSPDHVRGKDVESFLKSIPPSHFHSTSCYTVPVVFHILHLGGPENISEQQILDALRILNEDFRKLNPDTVQIVTAFKNVAADACIQFSLASKDPSGKCTRGILRHYDSLTFWTTIQFSNYKYAWPSDKYLNIYVVSQLPPGIGGYAFLPGTVGPQVDGIVILHSMVGSIGTSSPFVSRALTHEAGHWLGLSHVWGPGNNPGITCGDDGITDTPVTKGWTQCALSNNDICNPGIPENVQNYMEYSFCSCMFSQGQVQRMHLIIQNNVAGRGDLTSNQNLVQTGVINPNYLCPPRPMFKVNPPETFVSGLVTLTEMSDYSVPQHWTWHSDKSPFTYTTSVATMSFTRPGHAFIQLKVGNNYGTDSLKKDNAVIVQSSFGGTVNYLYDFENMSWTDTNWVITYPSMGSSFSLTNQSAFSGQKCLFINNYQDYPTEKISMYLPQFDLDNIPFPGFEFQYAYADVQSGSHPLLLVYARPASNTSTWTLLSAVQGSNLASASLYTGPFYPLHTSEWKSLSVPLNGFSGKTLIKLVFVPDVFGRSNNFFIDNLRVGTMQGHSEMTDPGKLCVAYVDASGKIILRCREDIRICAWDISDVSGKILYSSSPGMPDEPMSVSLPPGIYFGTWYLENGASIRKKLVLY